MKRTIPIVLAGYIAVCFALHAVEGWAQSEAREGDFYLLAGRGWASRGGDTEFYFQVAVREHITDGINLGFLYLNEGHPDTTIAGHRDGIVLALWRNFPVAEVWRFEVGAGPYLCMNTTWSGDPEVEYNEKGVGLWTSLALNRPVSDSALTFRAEIGGARVPNSFGTFYAMLGLGTDLSGGGRFRYRVAEEDKKSSVSGMAGVSMTTRATKKAVLGYEIEYLRKFSDRLAYSVSGLSEGGTSLSDRKGIAAQVWYVIPTQSRLKPSAGIGPYYVKEEIAEHRGTHLLGLASIDAKWMLSRTWHLLFRFNRVMSAYDKDQDMFLFGGGGMDF